MKDLLPALNLPTPLVIDFDYELKRSDKSENSESDASDSPTIESVPMPSISEDPLHPSKYFEIPTITVQDEAVASLCSSICSSSDSDVSMSSTSLTISLSPPPSKPLDWIWICHLCHSRYPLGATRRCLVDGHYYCSGESSAAQRNVKRRKRGASCSSEFDYVGWKEWGVWKRGLMASQERYLNGHDKHPYKLNGCENCEYPSECRYEKMKQPIEKTATSYFYDATSPTSPPADMAIKQQDEDVEMSDVSDSKTASLDSTGSTDTLTPLSESTSCPLNSSFNNSKSATATTNKRTAESSNPLIQSSGCSISRGSSASKPAKKSIQGRDKTSSTELQRSNKVQTPTLPAVHEENLLATAISAATTTAIQIPEGTPNHTVKFETRRFYSSLMETNGPPTSVSTKESNPPRQKQTKVDRKSDRLARKNKTDNSNTPSSKFEKSTFQPEASKTTQVNTTNKIKSKLTREEKETKRSNRITSSYRDGTYTRSSTSSPSSSLSSSDRVHLSSPSSSASNSTSSTQSLLRDFLGFGKPA